MGARVFSLTRSAFAGQQRTGAALWTGDTAGTWDMLRRQVASSINYPTLGELGLEGHSSQVVCPCQGLMGLNMS